jgi:thiol:disulfide interchange protein DsbC
MKTIPILLAISTISLYSASLELNAMQLKEIKKMNKVLQKSTIKIKKGLDKGSYYYLKLEQRSKKGVKTVFAFLQKEDGSLYLGNRYDKNSKKDKFPIDEQIVKDGVSFSFGSGKKDLYIATDPECPYCVKLEKQIHGLLDDYTVHVILYPLNFHKKAPAMVEWIMSGRDDVQKKIRMDKLMLEKSTEYKALLAKKGSKFSYSKTVGTKMEKSIRAIKELGVRGTPSVYDADYNKINWAALVKKLKAKAKVEKIQEKKVEPKIKH